MTRRNIPKWASMSVLLVALSGAAPAQAITLNFEDALGLVGPFTFLKVYSPVTIGGVGFSSPEIINAGGSTSLAFNTDYLMLKTLVLVGGPAVITFPNPIQSLSFFHSQTSVFIPATLTLTGGSVSLQFTTVAANGSGAVPGHLTVDFASPGVTQVTISFVSGVTDLIHIDDLSFTPVDPGDLDEDGILNSYDNCPTISNVDQVDADDDDVGDICDNCYVLVNPSQCDTDGDDYGNACDGDFNNNGAVTQLDDQLFTTSPHADMDCSGGRTPLDYNFYFLPQLTGGAPGPSGCVDTVGGCP